MPLKQQFFFMTKGKRKNNRPHGSSSWIRRAVETATQAAVGHVANKIDFNLQHGQRQPAEDAITQYHDINRVYAKQKKLSKKSIKRKKKKKRFEKKVIKALAKKIPLSVYEASSAVQTIAWGLTAWNTTPSQVQAGPLALGITAIPKYMLGETQYFGSSVLTTGIANYINNFINKLDTRWNGVDNAPPAINPGGAMILHQELNLAFTNLLTVPFNIDVYECVAARDMEIGDNYADPQSAWIRLLSTEPQNFGTGVTRAVAPNATDLGVTPYDAPEFGKHWKITSKTRIYLTGGQCTAMQFTNKPYYHSVALSDQYCARKGITKVIMFVLASEIGFGIPASTNSLSIVSSKQVHFKFPAEVASLTNGVRAVFRETFT